MDLGSNRLVSEVVPAAAPAMESWSPSVPIIGIAVMGIVGTAFLLVSYYVFVIKCSSSSCISLDDDDVFYTRFSLISRRRNNNNNNLLVEPRGGLEEAAIRTIPILNFNDRRRDGRDFSECSVCLNEFQEEEKLRYIPQCGHVFHMDCLDIWLQNNANCPLCRTSVSHQPAIPDYVVIELCEPSASTTTPPPTPISSCKKNIKTSMGDEVINTRRDMQKDDQRIHRRSFSMDSAGDRQLLVAMQQIMHHKRDAIVSPSPKTTFFSFANGHSRSAVQPLCSFQRD